MSVGMPPNPDAPRRKVPPQTPQKTVDEFWAAFTTKYPGRVLRILPRNVFAKNKAASEPKGTVYGQNVDGSYLEARRKCREMVDKISKECRRVNVRYRDLHFDLEFDLKNGFRRCLDSINGRDRLESQEPRAVKRVGEIFKDPKFYVDGAMAADVRQGKTGDCYFLAAVGALGNDLIERVCVAKDEQVGVYGFCFHRDGEWINTVIDDKLYLSIADYDESRAEKSNWSEIVNREDAEKEYREAFQMGSRALYFAQCNDPNETWLPLLEKAYAKAHGDYYSIIGGFTGEAIEDLTGGVTTELFASDILDKDHFWNEELQHVGTKFLFGCATGRFDDWQDGTSTANRQGIVSTHAYTILRADSYKDERLLLVRNPWGQSEWTGRWSDGSKEWTPESIQALNHQFGDDGMFWISFEDLLRKYQFFDRTRLFDSSWNVTQQWTSADVKWSADYNDTKFKLTLTEESPVVIALSQLDDRYWMGLGGEYIFTLHFRIDREGEDTYEVRSHGNYWMRRSVSTEVTLAAGTYNVFIKVKAERDSEGERVEDVIRRYCKTNQEKLLQVGLAYDMAHAKGIVPETEDAKRRRAEAKTRATEKKKKIAMEKALAEKKREWDKLRREILRERRQKARLDEHKKKKKAIKDIEALSQSNKEALSKPTPESAAKKDDPAPNAAGPTTQTDSSVAQLGSNEQPDNAAQSFSDAAAPAKPSHTAEENEWVVAGQLHEGTATGQPHEASTPGQPQDITASHITEAINEPLLADKGLSVPAMKVTDPNSATGSILPSPPASPAAAPSSIGRPPSEAGSVRTIVSWKSSVDSVLDIDPLEDATDSDAASSASGEAAEKQSNSGEALVDVDNAQFEDDPWNVVCVIGLRIYYQKGDVSVRVVRPKAQDEEEDTPLDVDDPSKSVEVPSRMGSQILPPKGRVSMSASQLMPGLEGITER